MAEGVRILVLTADYPPCAWSGIACAVEAQAVALRQAGAEVAVLTRRQYPGLRDGHPDVKSLDAAEYPYRGRRFDWIHLHSLALTELAWELRSRTGARIAYTAHSVVAREVGSADGGAFWANMQFCVMRHADAVVFPSRSERELALRFLPELATKARVIPNGLPEADTCALKARRAGGPIVFAGRFTAGKGITVLEKTLPLIQNQWAGSFVVAGGHGDECGNQAVARLRARLGDSLSAPGWLSLPQMKDLLSRAALVLVPSLYEPFGMIALEAMRAAAPVLAANTGGLAEIVLPESGGCLASSYDPVDWCEAAMKVLSDRTLAAELSRRGPPHVAKRFSARRAAQQLVEDVYAA